MSNVIEVTVAIKKSKSNSNLKRCFCAGNENSYLQTENLQIYSIKSLQIYFIVITRLKIIKVNY